MYIAHLFHYNVQYLFWCRNRSRSRISYIEWFDCYNGKTRGREREKERERERKREREREGREWRVRERGESRGRKERKEKMNHKRC